MTDASSTTSGTHTAVNALKLTERLQAEGVEVSFQQTSSALVGLGASWRDGYDAAIRNVLHYLRSPEGEEAVTRAAELRVDAEDFLADEIERLA